MVAIDVLKFPISTPADTTPLERLAEAGYQPSQILAVVGKTEGNGCVNDFSRTLASTVWEPRIPRDAVTVFSGGTEGVLCPHVTFIVRAHDADADTSTGLLAAVGHTRALQPHEIGSPDHARIVATTVKAMMTDLGVHDGDVELVLIKCPLLTSAKLESIRAAGREPITTDTYESMAKSRYASAIGIAAALGEVADTQIEASLLLPQQPGTTAWSAKASCSSGAELDDNHILILASDPAAAAAAATPRTSTGEKTRRLLRIISRPMQDAIDASAVLALLSRVKEERGEVVQLFAKAEADPRGTIRGNRHTMNTDSDIHGTRHARAAVGGLLAGLVGDTQLYVSGGAEGQGPPGGGSLCVVYRTSL